MNITVANAAIVNLDGDVVRTWVRASEFCNVVESNKITLRISHKIHRCRYYIVALIQNESHDSSKMSASRSVTAKEKVEHSTQSSALNFLTHHAS